MYYDCMNSFILFRMFIFSFMTLLLIKPRHAIFSNIIKSNLSISIDIIFVFKIKKKQFYIQKVHGHELCQVGLITWTNDVNHLQKKKKLTNEIVKNNV